MLQLVEQLLASAQQSRPVACCRLVETRGSTPQKAGAMMLVFADGSQAGTLGGGCVEAEVKRRALEALNAGEVTISRFQLDDDYGWDDGLICGGRMQVLIDPVPGEADAAYYRSLAAVLAGGQGGTEAIVFDAPADNGLLATSSYLFDREGRLITSSRANDNPTALDSLVRQLVPLASRPRTWTHGGVTFFPLLPRCRLLIVGGGHVGQAVAALAADLDFDVWVVDDRQEYVTAERFPQAERRVAGPIGEVLRDIEVTASTFCLIVTRGHNHDEEALFHLVDRGAYYVGMIGSRRKIRLIFDDLLAEGISQQSLDRVHAPVGLDIGSQSVTEIAVSIAAELIAVRNHALRRGVEETKQAGDVARH